MIGFRLFFFDRQGAISHAHELECDDEASAREMILARFADVHTELWRLNRKLGVFPARRQKID